MRRQDWTLDPVLFWTLAGLLVLHLFNLQPWMVPPVLIALAWRFLHDRSGLRLPGKQTVVILMAAGFGLVFLAFGNPLGREAGTTLLALAAGLKLLETHRPRDAYALLLLGFFLIITHFLFSQTPLTFAAMLLALTALVASLISLSTPSRELTPTRRLKQAGGIVLAGVPATLILFLLFPRPPGGLWGVQTPTTSSVTGLSDSMEPGQISDLSQSGDVAFRVRFDGEVPPNRLLYWRGPVLWQFDGTTWSRRSLPDRRAPVEAGLGQEVSYTVTLEPHGQDWLFALDVPLQTPPRARIDESLEIHSIIPVDNRLRYDMRSALDYVLEPGRLSERDRAAALALPEGHNPRLVALAAAWRGEPTAIAVERALAHFMSEPFSYTLSPGRLPEDNGMDHFLFEQQRGFCEHYASAFVLMMRAAGVPARVVTGYHGGEVNDDYLIVRQSDAHAWAEVWSEADGWLRVDPTGVIAPERIETGVADSVRQNTQLPDTVRREDSWQRGLALQLDQMENSWNQWVLGYDDREQRRLLSQLGLEKPGPLLLGALAIVGALLAWALVFWLLRRLPATTGKDPVDASWWRVVHACRRLGVVRAPGEAPRTLADRVIAAEPAIGPDLRAYLRLYMGIAYGRCENRRTRRQLLRSERRLRRRLAWVVLKRRISGARRAARSRR
ncbi:MAG: DUF3488 and DUF4129 domain-containing transglutaminase family protein [Halothiobacillaceae bacterium]